MKGFGEKQDQRGKAGSEGKKGIEGAVKAWTSLINLQILTN